MKEVRMIVWIVQDDSKTGGLDIKSRLVTGEEDFAQSQVNKMLEEETRSIVGWKLTEDLMKYISDEIYK